MFDPHSPRVTGMIADLSIMAECRHQVSLFQTWASIVEHEASQRGGELKDDNIRRTKPLHELIGNCSVAPLVTAGDASHGRFNYPVDKRKTPENTEAMQAAERNPNGFWNKVDS